MNKIADIYDDLYEADDYPYDPPRYKIEGTPYEIGRVNKVYVVYEGDAVVAISQSAMLHETFLLFKQAGEDLLTLAGITEIGYDLVDVSERWADAGQTFRFPPVAVWLKRMPGYFFTSAKYRVVPEHVEPAEGEIEWKMNDELESDQDYDNADFWHALSYVATALAETDFRLLPDVSETGPDDRFVANDPEGDTA